jgi:subtilisin family serine protease
MFVRLAAVAVAVAAVVAGGLPGVAAPALAADVPADARPVDGVVVKLRGGSVSQVADAVDGDVVAGLSGSRAVVQLDEGASVGEAVGELRRLAEVEWAEPNVRYSAAELPNDPCLVAQKCGKADVSQWAPAVVHAPEAWDVTHGSSSVMVAVVDGGVGSHPQLADKVRVGPDFTGVAPDSCREHATHVAGIIAADTDDHVGVAGLGWDTTVLSVRVLSFDEAFDECTGTLSGIAQGVDAAVAAGARVVNLSLAGSFDSRTIRESVRAAVRAGVVVVAAAGNAGQQGNPVLYPAAYPEVLSVTASTMDDRTASFSARGAWIDIAAPGARIVSTTEGGGYDELSGTSMAAPHAAAAAALVLAVFPGAGPYEVNSRISLGSDRYEGSGLDVRYGRLNMWRPLVSRGPAYWMVAGDGGIFAFGESGFFGSTGSFPLPQPVVAMAATPGRRGYWFVARDGAVFRYGDAGFFGSLQGTALKPGSAVVGMAVLPSGRGYWLVASDGAVFGFGEAGPLGSGAGRRFVGMASTPTGLGYWLVAADGSVLPFGDAESFGSMAGRPLQRPVVGMAPSPSGFGYWLVASDGGVFAFGDARFHGSAGSIPLQQPVVGLRASPAGDGYWLVAADGGVFAFDAPFFGSMGGHPLNRPVVGIA